MSTAEPPRPSFAETLEVRDRCLCFATQRAARALSRRFDDAFRPLELTNGQYSLMMALNQPQPPSLGRVADFLAMDRSTLTAALKPLVRRGLVAVAEDPRDRRGRRPSLTDAGRALLAAALPIWRETHAAVDAELDAAGAGPAELRAALWSLA
ncbi:MarR family winged helix-turn-helix transcriptional regulator [Albimonas pacifica]|uniref:DNA-binding transcriptional regulator, MarR family n=1 Tax=Albimonas pacifica TaxID=1114924 RepID=A0A1I3F2P3_9RHOB|nr:MarR family winged helix-turn-helix transcriptional regulator [Albimonas pacifica]SFI05494.1 DNA-binding transcriptional regulator, MarR family [Albimonas pacifica]